MDSIDSKLSSPNKRLEKDLRPLLASSRGVASQPSRYAALTMDAVPDLELLR